ncbi:glycerol-3-phosphate responsive antiterminator [Salmonella enterica subsp. enterica serovar Haifa]|nr:glycerol-3-phosphate responsive antiterminator [Salmonella enterica subsp. enterica serovar Haifa]
MNLPRATQAVASAQPGYVQIMPAPVLPYIRDEPIMTVSPVLAGGFISTPRDVIAALACGATGVSTSARALWTYKKEQQ